MQSIRVRIDQGKPLYDVAVDGGKVIVGLWPAQLGTYNGFRLAAALQGCHFRLYDLENMPRAWQKSEWLKRLAAAVQAGQQQAEPTQPPTPRRRKQRQ